MANKNILLVFCVLVGLSFTGCVMMTSVGGTVDKHGLFSSGKVVSSDGKEIGHYVIILGLFDIGYESYFVAVKVSVKTSTSGA